MSYQLIRGDATSIPLADDSVRCNDPALRAKVLRVDKPKAVPDGQLDMFGGEAA